MDKNFTEADRYYDAQKKVKDIKEFYQHLTIYLLCNPVVIVVNVMTSPEYLWCLWCLMGWGIPVIIHGLKAFGNPPFFNKKWEQRKIREILEKENQQRQHSSYENRFE